MATKRTTKTETETDETARVQEPNPLGTPEGTQQVKSLEDAHAAARAQDGDTTVLDLEGAQDAGYVGTSPAREATGLQDKGLSQRTILGG